MQAIVEVIGYFYLNLPWLLSWDFNAGINLTKHKGGTFDNCSCKSEHFANFIACNMFLTLGMLG